MTSYRGYVVDGVKLPSVTTIIGQTLSNPGIDAWKLRVGAEEAARVSREATDHGTGVHALVEAVNRGQHAALDADQAALVAPYARWHAEHVDTILGAETLLISRTHGYAGTTDAIAVLRGDRYPTIVDFKTSKTALAVAEWRLQTAAYAIAAEEDRGLLCRRRIIVRLSRTEPDTLHVHELPEDKLDDDRACFLALLHVWKWRRMTGEIAAPVSSSLGRLHAGRMRDD